MSTKNNPGAFRCFEAALPDEHIFTILARDPAGPATLRYWATERERLGKVETPDDRDRIDDARRDALLMEDWREKNLNPTGEGTPSWKMVRINDEEGGPIRVKPENIRYVPAERDGTEAVRLNVEWLTARTRDLVEGRMSREEYTNLIELACQSPDRRRDFTGVEEAEDSLLYRLEGVVHNLRDGRLPAPHDLYRAVKKQVIVHVENEPAPSPWTYECIGLGLSDLEAILQRLRGTKPVEHDYYPDPDGDPVKVTPLSFTRMSELLDYATCYGEFDENTPNGTISKYGERMSSPMNDIRRHAIWVMKRFMGIIPEGAEPPVAVNPPVAETPRTSRDVTEIETPEMPPHRFAMFDKGKGWAYGRGLEINPSHIPAMLDRMEADGYTLVAALGSQADKVGMIFQRGPRYTAFELAHGFGGPTREELERRRESPAFDRFKAGEPLDTIRADEPTGGACGMGRGQEP